MYLNLEEFINKLDMIISLISTLDVFKFVRHQDTVENGQV